MEEVRLLYTGKKRTSFVNDHIGAHVSLTPGHAFWVRVRIAEWLLRYSPHVFKEIDRRESGKTEEQPAKVGPPAVDVDPFEDTPLEDTPLEDTPLENEFVCPKCGAQYRSAMWFKRHVEKCGV